MTVRESRRLQSMDELEHLPSIDSPTRRALGNAVNVHLVRLIAEALLHNGARRNAKAIR